MIEVSSILFHGLHVQADFLKQALVFLMFKGGMLETLCVFMDVFNWHVAHAPVFLHD